MSAAGGQCGRWAARCLLCTAAAVLVAGRLLSQSLARALDEEEKAQNAGDADAAPCASGDCGLYDSLGGSTMRNAIFSAPAAHPACEGRLPLAEIAWRVHVSRMRSDQQLPTPGRNGSPRHVCVSGVSVSDEAEGSTFFFEAEQWERMVGTAEWPGKHYEVRQERQGQTVWTGTVRVENDRLGAHGQRVHWGGGQWRLGDVVSPLHGAGEEKAGVHVFYTIYQRDVALASEVVAEQLAALQAVGSAVSSVSYVTIGGSENSSYHCRGCQKIEHRSEGGHEVALQHLHDHCAAGRSPHVAYIHSVGSRSSDVYGAQDWRRFLMQGVLSQECLTPIESCHVCGSQFLPMPHHHVAGNMWVASCDYVKKLHKPDSFEPAMAKVTAKVSEILANPERRGPVSVFRGETGLRVLQNLGREVEAHPGGSEQLGTGVHSMEHWLLSHPSVTPCDVYAGRHAGGLESAPPEAWVPQLHVGPRYPLQDYGRYSTFEVGVFRWRVHEWKTLYLGELPRRSSWIWAFYSENAGTYRVKS